MEYLDDLSIAAWIKLDLLAQGVEIDPSVLSSFSNMGIALRKGVYNSPVWGLERPGSLPQELRVLQLIVGLNSYGPSQWRLEHSESTSNIMLRNRKAGVECRPEFVPDLGLFAEGDAHARVANLYGGSALAFFSPRSCYFFNDDTECGFCSLAGTAEETKDFKNLLQARDVASAVRTVLQTDTGRIEQVMIVGGNMRNLDEGFKHHVALAKAASDELKTAGVSGAVSVHIATMPPNDLRLINQLEKIENAHVMFNLEVWDKRLFESICPGKEKDYGRDKILEALNILRSVVGSYRAHSLLVAGLEPASSTLAGAAELAARGISPIINVYHSDRHSKFGLDKRPSFQQLADVARPLQQLYKEYPLRPYWRRCGRNALDAEAEAMLFAAPVPEFLTRPMP